MTEQPIFPDVIGLARDWLIDHLEVPVTVAMTVQDEEVSKRHPAFVRLRLSGGADATRVSGRVLLSVEAWSDTSEDAHDLAQETLALLRLLADDGGAIYKLNVAGLPADLPDPDSGAHRYVFAVEAHVRGTAYELSAS